MFLALVYSHLGNTDTQLLLQFLKLCHHHFPSRQIVSGRAHDFNRLSSVYEGALTSRAISMCENTYDYSLIILTGRPQRPLVSSFWVDVESRLIIPTLNLSYP